ncbi:hypothetical protein MKW94_028847 [Papaver nudicaule]|uniref:Uncharacterized protein n=1 Tax=Papaver nudicaule TaxID=74823 RepID=A0AA41VGX9_PAPNU|nr:hypothetical protein [Papaver nudicaule]
MAFHDLFVQHQTILTIKSTPGLLLHTHHSNNVPNTRRNKSHVRYTVSSRNSTDPLLPRRSANNHPNIWDFEFVESLTSDYKSAREICTGRAEKLKENVRSMFDGAGGLPYSLKLIDTIQRLGLDYHFRNEIKSALDKFYTNGMVFPNDMSMEALKFRLFRQHGYEISQDVLKRFIEENTRQGNVEDSEGLLSLYEASFYAYEGEELLKEAQQITSKHLKNYLKERNDNRTCMSNFSKEEINHSLEIPLLWRVPRMEVRRYIYMYEMKQNMHPTLLEFAKLDFNMVQATYHEELKYASRWWRDLALDGSLTFARNRLVILIKYPRNTKVTNKVPPKYRTFLECPYQSFLWSVGFNSEPKFRNVRRQVTKLANLITVIDEVYDVYGSLDELKIFTEADINTVETLPHHMKICFFALYNTVNEIGNEVLRNSNLDVMPYFKKSWGDLCKAFLVEATWYYSGYIPTLEEYTDNAWISASGPLVSVHAYCQLGDHENISKDALECITANQSDLIRSSSTIFRLANDLATSKDEVERGDVAKSIQCYMHETGASESIAREHVQQLISAWWTKMNANLTASRGVFPSSFINIIQNIARMAQYMYQYGDGYGVPNLEAKDRIMTIIVKPITF